MHEKVSGVADVGGIMTVMTSLFMTAWNLFASNPINSTFVIFTSLGGLIYLFYKIRNERKKSKLLDLQIKEKLESKK